MFGDKDPEDAYDATDPVDTRLDVLERVVVALEEDPGDDRFEARRIDALRVADILDDEIRTGHKRRRLRHIRNALRDM